MYTTNFWMGNMMRKAVEMDDFGGPPQIFGNLEIHNQWWIFYVVFSQINLYSPLFAGYVILITLR